MCPSLVCAVVAMAIAFPEATRAQGQANFPPDSLVNVRVFPKGTSVVNVGGARRNFTAARGVRCQRCHLGHKGQPLTQIDCASDEQRTTPVARQMLLMVAETNRRLDSIPDRVAGAPAVTCATCHRDLARPVPPSAVAADAALAAGADPATRTYRELRQLYHGRDAHDFGKGSLNTAAFRTARGGKIDDALALVTLNEEFFPMSSTAAVMRGNIVLRRADTAGATAAFREAMLRDPANGEARGRLRDVGSTP